MRTTLDLNDLLVTQAKRQALEEGATLTRFIEDALRARLHTRPAARGRFRFEPLTRGGTSVPGVDVEDRDALYERMEGRA